MFIVETANHEAADLDDYVRAYELIGSPIELNLAHRQLTSLALAAAIEGDITKEQAANLLSDTAALSPITITGHNVPAFLQIVTHAQDLAQVRTEQLIAAGTRDRGALGALAISDEIWLLDQHDGGPFYSGTTEYCNSEGLGMFPSDTEGAIVMHITSLQVCLAEGFFDGWEEEAVIKELPVTHHGFQYELPPGDRYGVTDVSDRTHISVGNVNEAGDYIPFATILNPAHPACAG